MSLLLKCALCSTTGVSTTTYTKKSRPKILAGTAGLVIRLARENPTGGYHRIHGELSVMGVKLSASSVWNILQLHGGT